MDYKSKKGLRKLLKTELDNALDVVRDDDGNMYEVSEEYYKKQIEQRQVNPDKQLDLELASELLSSNLRQLSQRQRDVLYYTMQRRRQKTIAKKLGISQEAVSKHLLAAKKILAKLILTTKEVIKGEQPDE